jgi:hypothetical protein
MLNDPPKPLLNESPASPWRKKSEIAEYYNCDIRTITNFMRRHILPYVKIGRFVRFNIHECDEAMAKHQRRSQLL